MEKITINTIEEIKQICEEEGITTYCIRQVEKEGLEMFFVRKKLDLHRKVVVKHFYVTLYRPFEKDGEPMLGSASVSFAGGYPVEEVKEKMRSAYFAASFVENKAYPLASMENEKDNEEIPVLHGHAMDLQENAAKMIRALYKHDNQEKTWINSAEIFLQNKTERIVNSVGVDVSFDSTCINGEFVTQSTEQEDVELYHDFCYEDAGLQAQEDLALKAENALEVTKARSMASRKTLKGKKKVILSRQYVRELMDYYVENSSAQMIYAGYSSFQTGENVQEGGKSIHIRLHSHRPYSTEGIKMQDTPIIQNGVLNKIHGDLRFSHYLHEKPTGVFDCVQMEAGDITMEEMQQEPYLHVISFSDFQVDTLSGFFGGEIRLAYYKEADDICLVTGGTISGNLNEQGASVRFSKEMQHEYSFEGPMAVSIEQVTVG